MPKKTYQKRFRNAVTKLEVCPALQQLVRQRLDLVVLEAQTFLHILLDLGRLDLVPRLKFPPAENFEILWCGRAQATRQVYWSIGVGDPCAQDSRE